MAISNPVFMRYRAAQYDGTNSTEVMTLLNSVSEQWLFDSADESQMIFTDLYATPFVLAETDWVVVHSINGFVGKYTDEEYAARFVGVTEITGP